MSGRNNSINGQLKDIHYNGCMKMALSKHRLKIFSVFFYFFLFKDLIKAFKLEASFSNLPK